MQSVTDLAVFRTPSDLVIESRAGPIKANPYHACISYNTCRACRPEIALLASDPRFHIDRAFYLSELLTLRRLER